MIITHSIFGDEVFHELQWNFHQIGKYRACPYSRENFRGPFYSFRELKSPQQSDLPICPDKLRNL